MENKEKFVSEKISEETRKKVEKMVETLKKDGYQFGYEETPDEFILQIEREGKDKGKRIHITKVIGLDADAFPKMIENAVTNEDYFKETDEKIEKLLENNKDNS